MPYNPYLHHRRSIRLKGYDYSQEGFYFITICQQDRECLFGEIVNGEMLLNDAGKMVDDVWLKIPERFPNVQLHEYIIMPNHFHAILEILEAVRAPLVGAPIAASPISASPIAASPIAASPISASPISASPISASPIAASPISASPIAASPISASPIAAFPISASPISASPISASPISASPIAASPISANDTDAPYPTASDDTQGATTRGAPTADPTASEDLKGATTRGASTAKSNDPAAPVRAPLVGAPDMAAALGDILGAFKSISTVEYIHGVKKCGWPTFNGKLWQRDYFEHIIRNERSFHRISKYILNNPKNWKGDKFY